MVRPVDSGEGERDQINDEGGQDGVEAGDAFLVRDFELEHHDGDDDGDYAVGEGFEAGCGGRLLGHAPYTLVRKRMVALAADAGPTGSVGMTGLLWRRERREKAGPSLRLRSGQALGW